MSDQENPLGTPEEWKKNRDDAFDELVGMGLSGSDAHITLDMVMQAKNKMADTLMSVAELAPSHLKILVYALSIDITFRTLERMDHKTQELLGMGLATAILAQRHQRHQG